MADVTDWTDASSLSFVPAGRHLAARIGGERLVTGWGSVPTDSTTHAGSAPLGPRFTGVSGPCE